MKELNNTNGADIVTGEYAQRCLDEFTGEINGAEFGVPYGGNVERLGKLFKGRGTVWGFDTFEGHPKQIAELCEDSIDDGGLDSHAAKCMDYWYEHEDYGTDKIKYDYIRSNLDAKGLGNVKLIKGLVTDKTNVNFINKLHYVMIDLDFPLSQWDAYNLVKHKIVKGGYLCLHDMIPEGHIKGCYERYQDMLSEGLFDVELEDHASLTVVLKKK